MGQKESTLGKQVEQWALLGPFIMMILLMVLIINPLHQPLYVPILAIIGTMCCWRWKISGLLVALGALGALLSYQLFSSPAERIFWDIMVAAAAALTFSITALCGKEIEELIGDLEQESAAHLHSFLTLNERIQGIEEGKHHELSSEIAKNALLQSQFEEEKTLLNTLRKEFDILQQKMSGISAQNESLLRELFQKRHECEKLIHQSSKHAELMEAQMQNYSAKEEQLETREKEIEALRAAEQQYELKISELSSTIAGLQEKIANFSGVQPKEANLLGKEPQTKELAAKEPKKAPGKSKNGKPTKTNDWANTILSRWSEPHDPSQ